MNRKEKQEQELMREKFRASVSGMSDQRLTVELEKRRKKISEISKRGKENDSEYREALSQFGIISEVIRERLGSRSRTDGMQIRGIHHGKR